MTTPNLPTGTQPIHKSAQRMRWVLQAFEHQVAVTAKDTGNRFTVDRNALAQAFAEWFKAFEAQKPDRPEDKQAYVGFAAGLMLRALIRNKPVRLEEMPPDADKANPTYFWPEGYLYSLFCLNLRGLVLEADFDATQHPANAFSETRTWWSFKENVAEDPSLAIAFLDLFAGDDPEWQQPALFRTNRRREVASPARTQSLVRPDTNRAD
jgi:hypothetical protein